MSSERSMVRLAQALMGLAALAGGPAIGAGVPAPHSGRVPPTLDGIQEAARQAGQAGCLTEQCRAITAIARVMQIELNASAATMGVPRPIPAGRDTRARRDLARLLSAERPLFGAMCQVSASIVSQYSRPGVAGEVFVPVTLLGMGHEMETYGGTCLPTLLGALPRSAQASSAIAHAETLCEAARRSEKCSEIERK